MCTALRPTLTNRGSGLRLSTPVSPTLQVSRLTAPIGTACFTIPHKHRQAILEGAGGDVKRAQQGDASYARWYSACSDLVTLQGKDENEPQKGWVLQHAVEKSKIAVCILMRTQAAQL